MVDCHAEALSPSVREAASLTDGSTGTHTATAQPSATEAYSDASSEDGVSPVAVNENMDD